MSSLALGHATAHLIHRWLLEEGAGPPASTAPLACLTAADDTACISNQLRQQQPDAVPRGTSLMGAAARFLPGTARQRVADVPPPPQQARGATLPNGEGIAVQRDSQTESGVGSGLSERGGSVGGRRPELLRRLSLEEAEEQLPGAEELDEETREDQLVDRISAAIAVPW